MARLSFLQRRHRDPDEPRADAPPPAPRRRAGRPPGSLRRERRALLRAREQRLRDLGGLALEMYRQDSFRQSLLEDGCAEIAGIEERLYAIDTLLLSASGRRQARVPASRCSCGAPLPAGARFCASCGRPA